MKNKKNNKGFTLVELLVVIAIIGILAVVAVPALFKNIEKGKVADLEADISAMRSAVLSYYANESGYPFDINGENKAPVSLTPSMNISSAGEATKKINSELEGLSFPYEGSYKLTDADGEDVAESPGTLYMTITTDGEDVTVSQDGLDKLGQDLGLTKSTDSVASEKTYLVKDATNTTGQTIIIPLVKN